VTARGSCGSTRWRDGEGGGGATGRGASPRTAPPLEWTVVLDGVRREAAAGEVVEEEGGDGGGGGRGAA
jgi:hypothetical protein